MFKKFNLKNLFKKFQFENFIKNFIQIFFLKSTIQKLKVKPHLHFIFVQIKNICIVEIGKYMDYGIRIYTYFEIPLLSSVHKLLKMPHVGSTTATNNVDPGSWL